MRYRREDTEGDYTFGQGDDTFLIDSPECVAQAVKTRFELWRGQWFLDLTEGTPYVQSVLGKQRSDVYILAIRERIQDTPGVLSILSFDRTPGVSCMRSRIARIHRAFCRFFPSIPIMTAPAVASPSLPPLTQSTARRL